MEMLQALLLTLLAAQVYSDEVVLKNGQILRGDVRREGDKVIVVLEKGRVILPAHDISEIRKIRKPVERPANGNTPESSDPPRDADIEAAVKRELEADTLTGDMNLAVRVRDGTVLLSGQADTLEERERSASIARTVAGVLPS